MDALPSAIKNELIKEIQELETTAAFTESEKGEFIISNLNGMKLKTLVHVSFVSHLSRYNAYIVRHAVFENST